MKHRFLLIAFLLLSAHAPAEEVMFYRCTDAGGAITLQSMPCPKDSRQEKKPMQGVSPAAPYVPAPVPATPTAPAAMAPVPGTPSVKAHDDHLASDIADEDRLPPPPLFQCTTYDKDSYTTEDSEPQKRCAPLQTTGLDGNPQGGAGQACQVFTDICARVPDGAICETWQKTLREAQARWRFAAPENSARRKEEYERIRKIVSESTCGASTPSN